eukprot:689747_1
MSENPDATHNETQVNLVLEPLLSPNNSQQQAVGMLGFVMISDIHMKLSNLRSAITQQLDDQQLESIGINFKFLKKHFPVSLKQEKSIKISTICTNNIPSQLSAIYDANPVPKPHTNPVPNTINTMTRVSNHTMKYHEHELKSNNIDNKKDNHYQYIANTRPFIPINKQSIYYSYFTLHHIFLICNCTEPLYRTAVKQG